MEQFLAALLEAEQFITKYPDRAQAILRKVLKMDAETILGDWSSRSFSDSVDPGPARAHGTGGKVGNPQQSWCKATQMPNYLDFFYFNALDKVKPEAVSIVH